MVNGGLWTQAASLTIVNTMDRPVRRRRGSSLSFVQQFVITELIVIRN